MTDYNEKAKIFLEKQLAEYETKITKLKKKRKIIKSLFTSVIVISVSSSAVCAALAPVTVPVFIIPILSTTACITTALSTKFNLKGRKAELNQTIEQLNKIKRNIEYVVSCNGNFTEVEFKCVIRDCVRPN